jgi:hypothetical protein
MRDLVLMKRKALALTLVWALLFSAVAGTVMVNLAQSNPVAPADIEVYSPQNKVYYSNKIELGFIAPSRYIYSRINFTSFSYSLDGQAKVPIIGNTTVTGLSWGTHSMVVYGEDTDGNTRSSWAVRFDVFFPTAWIVTATAILAAFGIGLLAYFRKRKR